MQGKRECEALTRRACEETGGKALIMHLAVICPAVWQLVLYETAGLALPIWATDPQR